MSSERSGRLSLPLLPLPLCVVENPDFIVPTFHPWSTYACQKTRAWPVCPVALCWDPSSHGGLRSQHWAAGEGSSTRRSRTAFWLAMPSSPLSLPLPPEKCFVYLDLGGDSEGDVIATIMVVRRLWAVARCCSCLWDRSRTHLRGNRVERFNRGRQTPFAQKLCLRRDGSGRTRWPRAPDPSRAAGDDGARQSPALASLPAACPGHLPLLSPPLGSCPPGYL